MNQCPNCGSDNETEYRFCTFCGLALAPGWENFLSCLTKHPESLQKRADEMCRLLFHFLRDEALVPLRNVMLAAYCEGFPQLLSSGQVGNATVCEQFLQNLYNHWGIADEAARKGLESWSQVLQVAIALPPVMPVVQPVAVAQQPSSYSAVESEYAQAAPKMLALPLEGVALKRLRAAFQAAEPGSTISFGRFVQEKGAAATALEWLVTAKEEDTLLLTAKQALTAQAFDHHQATAAWAEASLSSWLNGEFLTSTFNELERGFIAPAGASGLGAIFLLDLDEAQRYFANNALRRATPTALAAELCTNMKNDGCWWWLRSPGENNEGAAIVGAAGDIQSYLGHNCTDEGGGVRPSLRVHFSVKN